MLFGYTIAKTQLDYALLEAFLAFLGDGQQGGRHRVGGGSGGATLIDANITNGCELYGMNRMYAVHAPLTQRKGVEKSKRVKSDENIWNRLKHHSLITLALCTGKNTF